jgi:hypothetical protein
MLALGILKSANCRRKEEDARGSGIGKTGEDQSDSAQVDILELNGIDES